MNPHARSGIAIVVTLGFLAISWFVGHRPADWEYVFFMFVVFSSALQDAMDGMNSHLEKVTRLLKISADKIDDLTYEVRKQTEDVRREIRQEAEYLRRDVEQQAEYLRSYVTAEAILVKYGIALMHARDTGEDAPDKPQYPEPKLVESKFVDSKFVVPEPPKLEPFDAQKFRAERLREVADALRDHGWWDMSLVTTPLRRLFAYVASRPAFIRWVSND
jgi:hypothetical protein